MNGRIDISPMVERVARALAVANGAANNGDDLEHFSFGPHHAQARWLWHVNDARAAIEAMREPTATMTEAGHEHTGDPCWEENVADAWRAMITAALREPSASDQITTPARRTEP